MILKCAECGLESNKHTFIEAIKELSNKKCTFAFGTQNQTWCQCGAKNSFERMDINNDIKRNN